VTGGCARGRRSPPVGLPGKGEVSHPRDAWRAAHRRPAREGGSGRKWMQGVSNNLSVSITVRQVR
jgi:hypothetical protein